MNGSISFWIACVKSVSICFIINISLRERKKGGGEGAVREKWGEQKIEGGGRQERRKRLHAASPSDFEICPFTRQRPLVLVKAETGYE